MSAFLIFSVRAFEVGLRVTFLFQVCKNFCDSTLSADLEARTAGPENGEAKLARPALWARGVKVKLAYFTLCLGGIAKWLRVSTQVVLDCALAVL